jgi:hypothetical protein
MAVALLLTRGPEQGKIKSLANERRRVTPDFGAGQTFTARVAAANGFQESILPQVVSSQTDDMISVCAVRRRTQK